MIFKKKNPIPQIYRKRYTNEFEYMFVFSKGEVKTHNPIKIPTIHGGLELKVLHIKITLKVNKKEKK